MTPAKVNIGLEVTGRRADGYHEIVTLMQAISLYDRFEWTATGNPFEYEGPEGVDPADDLVARVFSTAPDRDRWTGRLQVVKRIPLAAGLGGGSTDAALALRLSFPSASSEELHERAAALGADVPFFLRGGTALATGTGATLEWLESLSQWFVLVTPHLSIPQKTATMYRGLRDADFSDGVIVRDIATRLRDRDTVSSQIPNAFVGQLLQRPSMRYAYASLERAGGSAVSVSGAGPTLYAMTRSYADAARIAARLRAEAGARVGDIRVVRSVGDRGDDPAPAMLAAAMRGEGASGD